MWTVSLSALVAFATAASAFTILPPENGWAKTGSTKELICKADKPIEDCHWDTPYGKSYTMKEGRKAEDGRLEYTFGQNAKMECGIKITKVEASDNGDWECNIGIVDDAGNLLTSKGKSRLSIAQKPKNVTLIEPFDGDFINVTSEAVEVQCKVENAMPAPVFVWKIDDEVMENAVTSDDLQNDLNTTWIQTLTYQPKPEHHNRTLTCQISHIGFEEGDVTMADAIVDFSGADGAGGSNLLSGNKKPYVYDSYKSKTRAVTIVVIFAVCLIAVCTLPCFARFYYRKWRGDFERYNNGEEPVEKKTADAAAGDAKEAEDPASEAKLEAEPEAKDAEAEESKDNDKTADGEDKDAKKEEDAAAPSATPSFGQKIASFFRLKSEPLVDDKKTEDVEATSDEEKEETKADDDQEVGEKTDKKPAASRLSSVWKLIKWPRAGGNATDKKPEVEMEEGKSGGGDADAKEKAATEEEGEKKMVELEPEDKPEKVPEEEAATKAEESEQDQKPEADREQPDALPATPKEEAQLPSSPKNTPV